MNNYFYVDIDEEITSVIGRIRKGNSEELFLVVPKRALIAQSLVNLKLLSKEANKLKKNLIFVSPDALTRKIAEKAGLSVKKYVAKPKDDQAEKTKSDKHGFPLPQRKQPMQPWEEAAAKEELKSAIKKNESEKSSPVSQTREIGAGMGVAGLATGASSGAGRIQKPPVKLKAGVFTAPGKIAKKMENTQSHNGQREAPAKPQVVDLKKMTADARLKSEANSHQRMAPKKIKSVFLKEEKADSNLMEEPELKELLKLPDSAPSSSEPRGKHGQDSEDESEHKKTAIADNENNRPVIRPGKKAHLAKINPFKVRKIIKEAHNLPPVAAKENLLPPAEEASVIALTSSIEPPLPIDREDRANIAPLPNVQENTVSATPVQNALPKDFERETANLTIKEKERLRDLWMEQKKVVRGKSFQESTSLDLKSSDEMEARKEEVVAQETGLFQTTHRRVVGPGKVIDLRVAASPLASLPNKLEDRKQRRKGKEIILPLMNVKLFLSFVIGILVVLLVIVGIILPEATVVIKPKKISDNFNFKTWVSGEISQVDLEQRTIPGKAVRFKVSEEKLFTTTAQKEIKENSVGQVTVSNQSGQSLSLKQNALLTDSSGNKFYTTAPITISAAKQDNTNANSNDNASSSTASSATVDVKSEGSGKDYNLKEGAVLNIPGLKDGDYSGLVTVEVKKEIKGGESRIVKTVSQEDLDKAKDELVNKAKEGSLEGIKNNLDAESAKEVKPEDLVIEDVSFSADKTVGQEADSFNASVSATFFTVSFDQKDLQDLAKNIVESDREDKNGSIKVNSYQIGDSNPLENKIEVSANLDYQIINQINGGEVKKDLVAKKRQEAEDYLRGRSDIEQYSLNIWPRFLGHVPILERRVKVEIQ